MIVSAQRVFDGVRMHSRAEVVVEAGRIAQIRPASGPVEEGILAPGLVDLQVNGGGGVMVGPETLDHVCEAHGALGSTSVMPTLITDTPEATARVVEAALDCRHAGFAGLHLEGPHLDPRRKGAHDAALIRPMEEADLALILRAAAHLPALMVTVAPESVTAEQIARMAAAGVTVSLGHSDCDAETARAAIAAGAACVTHLFNAMSQMAPRAPGLAGAALALPVAAGLIADGVHVDPMVLRVALAKPELFLVTDCMAVQGSDLTEFRLGGRRILRRDGRLTLEDGTLAGADLTLPRSLRQIVAAGAGVERALAMATRIPAALIGAERGRLAVGARADMVLLSDELHLRRVWRAGTPHPAVKLE